VIGRARGTIVATRAGMLEAELPFVRAGDTVAIRSGRREAHARVVALEGTRATLAPSCAVDGIARGDVVTAAGAAFGPLGTLLLGRAIDASGAALDGGPAVRSFRVGRDRGAPALDERRPCTQLFQTGIRGIDGPLAFGRGARIGIFGPPGAGKSTLVDAVTRGSDADATVVALIGERGREAERRVEALDARTTVVCATSDRSPAERLRAAEVAFAQAGALRARGLDVLLIVDSLARIAAAAREIALAAGEAPGRGGFPPSVFAVLARLLERAGPTSAGSVTLVATILSDGPDEHDPVSEAARAGLDGHLVLCERLARMGRFPAIDLGRSTSRTFAECAGPGHVAAARLLRAAVAALDESREARGLGIDAAAGDPFLPRCLAQEPAIDAFLRQDGAPSPFAHTLACLEAVTQPLRA
jgi:type III secretion protein N (ATPase)